MTDNEIKKALECCRTNLIDDCKRCSLRLEDGTVQPFCTTTLIGNALNLINRLQARVEKCEKVEHFADKTIATLQAENERLQKDSKRLKKVQMQLDDVMILYSKIKAEAYKEFAEELNNKGMFPHEINDDYAVGLETINKLLKEKVGEDK